MIPKTRVTVSFKCPSCGVSRREALYARGKIEDRSACASRSCQGCGSIFRIPFNPEDPCEICPRRIECLTVPKIQFYKDVKIRLEEIPIWTDRIARVREKGVVRVAKFGNIHRALGTFKTHERSYSGIMRGSRFGMWEVMLMLTYGFIEKHGPMGSRGGYYTLTQVGKEARNQLDISEKRKGQLVLLPVSINEKWFEYFKKHQW